MVKLKESSKKLCSSNKLKPVIISKIKSHKFPSRVSTKCTISFKNDNFHWNWGMIVTSIQWIILDNCHAASNKVETRNEPKLCWDTDDLYDNIWKFWLIHFYQQRNPSKSPSSKKYHLYVIIFVVVGILSFLPFIELLFRVTCIDTEKNFC